MFVDLLGEIHYDASIDLEGDGVEIKLTDQDLDTLANKVANVVMQKVIDGIAHNAAFAALEEKGKRAADFYLATKPDLWAASDVFKSELAKQAHTLLPTVVRNTVDEVLGSKDGLRRAVIAQVVTDAKVAASERVIRHLQALQEGIEDDEGEC